MGEESRDIIIRSLVMDLQHYREQMLEVETAIKELLPYFRCTLMTMPGIDIVTAAEILTEIGNRERFPNASKLAKFAGISRRLVNIVYGMLKNHTEYRKPERRTEEETV